MEITTEEQLAPADESKPQRILVAEDDEPIRVLWKRFLSRWGYAVDLAENGKIALNMARQEHYDLLITDLTMPEMAGGELVHTLKKEQPELEIIVTTGFATVENAVEMMKAGAHEFITKPISFKHAEQLIQRCLNNADARRENVRLRQINKDLAELNEMKEKFIAITNHELRTPVSLITSAVEILAEELEGHPAEPMVETIGRATRQLREIIEQMHDLSRATSGDLELQRTNFNLNELCIEISQEAEMSIKERGHDVSFRIPGDLVINGDRIKIKMAVRELLQNAIKYSVDGGSIIVSAETQPEGQVAVSVADKGIGIADSEKNKIFEMFYEVRDSEHHHSSNTHFQGGGMGIGLAMVSEIVGAHGGTVTLQTKVGEGSTFAIAIPQDSGQGV